MRRETKDRGGKVVVVVYGFAELPGANAVMIGNLAKELKGKLGCGGSFDRQEIVLQGDRCPRRFAGVLEDLGVPGRWSEELGEEELFMPRKSRRDFENRPVTYCRFPSQSKVIPRTLEIRRNVQASLWDEEGNSVNRLRPSV